MQFIPNSKLVEQEAAEAQTAEQAELAAREAAQPTVLIQNISASLETKWQTAKRHKRDVEMRMLQSKRARNGEYESDKLAAIRQLYGATYQPVYVMVTETKCRAAESWINEILFPVGKVPWDIEPTPIPDLPDQIEEAITGEVFQEAYNMVAQTGLDVIDPMAAQQAIMAQSDQIMPAMIDAIEAEVMERAREAAGRMQKKIADQFAEGGWEAAVKEAIHDLCTYQAAFVKGPYVVRKPVRKRVFQEGQWTNIIEDQFVTKYSRRSPLDIYPGPGGTDVNDTYLFDKIKLTYKELQSLLGVEGFNDDAIRAVLADAANGRLKLWTDIDSERALAEGRDSSITWESTEDIDCLEYWGIERGSDLLQWGMTPEDIPDPLQYYDICAWKIGTHVIKAMLNPDPLGHKPYSKVCFVEDPDNFWNKSLPELIKHIQDMCNAVARSMVNNVGIASGPQVEVNSDRMPAGADLALWPWKVWESTNDQMQEGKAVNFYAPPLITTQLIELYNFFLSLADEESGVPRFVHGQNVSGGALDTASGFSMLISQAARGIKNVIAHIDAKLIGPTVERQYYYNLDYEKVGNEMIGDMKIVAKGTASLVAKEQQAVRKRELLGETNNPVDLQITGLEGRKEMLKDMMRALDMDVDKIIQGESAENKLAQVMALPKGAPSPASETIGVDGGQPVGGDAAVARDQEKKNGQGGQAGNPAGAYPPPR